MAFKKAERKHAKLHLALAGPPGSGKTLTGLILAHYIAKNLGKGRVAVIDTERGRSRLYAGHVLPDGDVLDFDVEDKLPNFSPAAFVTAIRAAEKDGYDMILVDSTSHEWRGAGGVLEKVDNAAASGNKWAGWRVGTPAHNEFVDALLQSKCHIIGTMRSKTEWILEEVVNRQGVKTQAPKAVGVGVVQRDDTDYEFDFVGLFDDQHTLKITKTCFKAIDGKSFSEPGADLAQVFVDWLLSGGVKDVEEPEVANGAEVAAAAVVPPPAKPPEPAAPHAEQATSPAVTDQVKREAAQDSTAAAAAVVPAETGAQGFARLMGVATSLAALDAIAAAIGPAVKAGKVSSAERGALVQLYSDMVIALRAGEKAA